MRAITFPFVQALRGIAAMMVLLHHAAAGRHIDALLAAMPAPVRIIVFDGGWAGVPIFFALSGFVIAHSLAGKAVDGRFFLRFVVRRSIRLDPPYWASMLLFIGLGWLSARVAAEAWQAPGRDQILAHVTYTQVMTGVPQFGGVYWTLTYEVQFYLVLVASAVIARRLGARIGAVTSEAIVAAALLAIAVAWGSGLVARVPVPGLFVSLWAAFFAGVLAYRARESRAALGLFVAFAALMLAVAAPIVRFSVLTALLLWVADRTGWLVTGLRGRWLQSLGAVSYSLYLTHNPISGAAFFVARRLVPGGAAAEAVRLAVVIATCLIVAALFRWLIEAPSQRWAKTVGMRRDRPAPATAPATIPAAIPTTATMAAPVR